MSTGGETRSSRRWRSGACRRGRPFKATASSSGSAGSRTRRLPWSRVGLPTADRRVIPAIYRCFSVATSFTEDRYFTAADVVPGNSKIVHHVLAMVDGSGLSANIPSRDGEYGYPCFGGPGVRIDGYLGGWAPGARPWELPEGVGILLPKGARVVFQLHYHNARLTPETDLTELRLRAASGPVQKRLHFMRVGQFRLAIPAGAPRHEIEAQSFVYQPMRLIAIHPHMHLLGREMKVWARMKDESVQPLIHIPDWDFHWQGFYFYQTPVALPTGSWIELMAAWDNSEQNPRNPNMPPRDVSWARRRRTRWGMPRFSSRSTTRHCHDASSTRPW